MPAWKAAVLLFGAGIAAIGTPLAAPVISQTPPTLEYQVKAVFLLRFAQFVEWPREAFAADYAPLVIGVLGRDPFGSYLDEVVRNETVDGRPLVVRRFARIEESGGSHILFVSRSEVARLRDITGDLKSKPVLLVGDDDRFANEGGMIAFVIENQKVRFRINLDAARAAGLTLSSKLLRSAIIVESKEA